MNIETLLNKSNGDLFNFYIKNNNLYFKSYCINFGWTKEVKIFDDVDFSDIDIKIDENDNIYGIISHKYGEIFYLDVVNESDFNLEKLFIYDYNEYRVKCPVIKKIGNNIHIIYYVCSTVDESDWILFSHYFNKNIWSESNIDIIKSDKYINPFCIKECEGRLHIFYLNEEKGCNQLYMSNFDFDKKAWNKPIEITKSQSKKIYLNVLYDEKVFHIVWCEYKNNNLIVKYLNLADDEDKFEKNAEIVISEESNCSMPCLLKIKNILWCVWHQMNKVYSSYSKDFGLTWSEPLIDEDNINKNIIKYRFDSNLKEHKSKFKVDVVFGINNPCISFVGIKRKII